MEKKFIRGRIIAFVSDRWGSCRKRLMSLRGSRLPGELDELAGLLLKKEVVFKEDVEAIMGARK